MDTATTAAVGPGAAGQSPEAPAFNGFQVVIPSGPGPVRVESVARSGHTWRLAAFPQELLGLRIHRGDVVDAVTTELRMQITMLQLALDAINGADGALALRVIDRRPVQGCKAGKAVADSVDHGAKSGGECAA